MKAEHTPGPWKATWHNGGRFLSIRSGEFVGVARVNTTNTDRDANASLIAAAPDHALVASSIVAGIAIWYPFSGSGAPHGELCFGGFRFVTTLDEFGVPRLNDHVRAALKRATGESHG